jgi:uncharacterized membrane protein
VIYLVFKFIHIAAVIIFLGNIITGVFWKKWADRTRDLGIMAHALEGIIAADRLFTIPGVIVIVFGGFGAAGVQHIPVLRTGWVLWGIVLFTLSGIAFMAQLVPLQRRMAKMTRAGVSGGAFDWALYEKLSRAWDVWGLIALLAPLIAAAMMVLKPELPSL